MKILIVPSAIEVNEGSPWDYHAPCYYHRTLPFAKYLKADVVGTDDTAEVVDKYDAVIFQKAYRFDRALRLLDRAKKLGIKTMFDLPDAEWLHSETRKRQCWEMVDTVDIVTCSNDLLTHDVKFLSKKDKVFCVPDRLDLDLFEDVKRVKKNYNVVNPVYVWFGGAKTYIRLSATLLNYLILKRYPLKVIGSQLESKASTCYRDFVGVTEKHEWNRASYHSLIAEADIGLDPDLDRDVDSGGNWSYHLLKYRSLIKTLEFWACGVPVAKTIEEIEKFRDFKTRMQEVWFRQEEIKQKWDARISAVEILKILESN